jgi:hypothetical protein
MITNHFLLIISVRNKAYLSDQQVNIAGEIFLQFILRFEIILYDGMILIFEIYLTYFNFLNELKKTYFLYFMAQMDFIQSSA